MNINLKNYGLNERFEQEATLYNGLFIARVTEQHRDLYKVVSEYGEIDASVSGKFAYHANDQTSFPAVGDWVMIDRLDGSTGNNHSSYPAPQKRFSAAICRYGKCWTGDCGQY